MENLNELKSLLGTFNTMLENKEFAALLKQNKQETLEKQLSFTEKEINKMPKTFRKEFRTDGCTARIYKRLSRNTYVYDIMYRRNGYKVIVSDTNLESAKKRFIEKLQTAQKVEKVNPKKIPTTFHSFAMYHFENFRKKKVKEKTK